MVEGKLELCLAVALDDHLLPLLAAQGLTYNVHVVKKGEDRFVVVRGLCKTLHHKCFTLFASCRHAITVYAEKETCCGLQLIWAVAIQTKMVRVESLEQLAGLAVAKVRSVLFCADSKCLSKLTLILARLQALKSY